jgi:hypothetical protein
MVKNFDNAKYKAEKSVEQMRKDKSLYISFWLVNCTNYTSLLIDY